MIGDTVDLLDFYKTPLGHATASLIHKKIAKFWPSLLNLSLLGVGYATPYLEYYRDHTERVLCFMPAQQGVVKWPEDSPSLTALIHETMIPLPNESVDRILLVHSLEHAEQPKPFLREIWRVLAGNGRLLIITPNRRGLWARLDHTPFGHGRPYTMTQLSQLLRDSLFTPVKTDRGLYLFPSHSRLMISTQSLCEAVGGHMLQKFSGIICIEAVKQVYSGTPVRIKRPLALPGLIEAK